MPTYERDNAAEERDSAADQRDTAAEERDTAAERRDSATEERDGAAEERGSAAQRRDSAADKRDTAADERDTAADERDTATDDVEERDSGVDAPAKEIADLAGVGVGTLYRHFPRRADLIKAVIERDIDASAAAAPALLAVHDPGAALALWLLQYTDFLAIKPALAPALHSGDPAFDGLRGYFWERLGPALESLLDAATASGEIHAAVSAKDILSAIAHLSHTAADEDAAYSQRTVALLIDGLRFEAPGSSG
jgi:AcrR family transcriptional regulator